MKKSHLALLGVWLVVLSLAGAACAAAGSPAKQQFDSAPAPAAGPALAPGAAVAPAARPAPPHAGAGAGQPDARLRNLKATEARYLDLLGQAKTVDDVLKVEQQLSNVRGQIEQLQGRLNYLRQSADTSTITVELRLPASAQTPPPMDWSVLPI